MSIKPTEALTDYLNENPFGFVGFRVLYIIARAGGENIPERREVPYVGNILFPMLLVGYLFLSRVRFIVAKLRGRASSVAVPADGHVFVISATRQFRSHTLVSVARELRETDEVVLLCSPEAEAGIDTWREEGFDIFTHRELHGRIPLSRLPGYFVRAIRTVVGTYQRVPDDVQPRPDVLILNLTFLEFVKHATVEEVTRNEPRVHTLSPMPYLIESTTNDRLFVYQHGIQWPDHEEDYVGMAIPFYTPLIYLIWGEPWRGNFERYAHPDSRILEIGSPWYDYLTSQHRDGGHQWDVLLVGGFAGTDTPDDLARYRSFVETVVETCEENELSLVIKCHPNEDGSRYRNWGVAEYVYEFDSLLDALMSVRLAITDCSSTFVESSVLGTHVVVADIFDIGLSSLAPVRNVTFTDGMGGVSDAIERILLRDEVEDSDDGEPLVRLGGSARRIADVVSPNRQRG